MGLFSDLINTLIQLAPIRPVVVRGYQQGVEIWRGQLRKTLEPGIYAHIKWLREILIIDVKEQGINLVTQSITTKDDVPTCLSVNLSYEILDARLAMETVHDLDVTLSYEAMRFVARAVRRRTYTEVRDRQRALENAIERSLQRRVLPWGVHIMGVGLTDFTKARHYRLFGDPGRQLG